MCDKIQLLLMVKNGADLITRSLESFVDQVDRFVILDTGSTDNTIKLIEEFRNCYSQDVVIINEEFLGFDKSRNSLLDHAFGWEGKWSVMIDDSYILKGNLRESLHAELHGKVYSIVVSDDMVEYPSSRVIGTRYLKEIRYEGSIHEYLNHAPFGVISGVKLVDVKCEGHRIRTTTRNLSDVEKLRSAAVTSLEDECRRAYYIAMTKHSLYRVGRCDIKEVYDALVARVVLPGDPEEKMFAIVVLGGLHEVRGDKVGAAKCYLLAGDVFPERKGECYFYAWLMSNDEEHLRIARLNRLVNFDAFRFPFSHDVYKLLNEL